MWNDKLTSLKSKVYTICVYLDIGKLCYGQLTAVKIGYPLTSITWAQVYNSLRWLVFLKFSADQLLVFSWSQANDFKSASRLTFIWKSYNKILKGWARNLWFWLILSDSTTALVVVQHRRSRWCVYSCSKIQAHKPDLVSDSTYM